MIQDIKAWYFKAPISGVFEPEKGRTQNIKMELYQASSPKWYWTCRALTYSDYDRYPHSCDCKCLC